MPDAHSNITSLKDGFFCETHDQKVPFQEHLIKGVSRNFFSYISTKTYIVGTH